MGLYPTGCDINSRLPIDVVATILVALVLQREL